MRAALGCVSLLCALAAAAPASAAISNAERCDPIDPAHCMFPFPNDHFTEEVAAPAADRAAGYTGRRIDFHLLSMPRNRAGVPINPLDYQRNDGFSPGNVIITHVPGLDSQAAFERTGAVPITDIGRYDDPDQPIVVIDAETGERHPIWSEIDSNPLLDPDDGEPDPEDVNLLIRPAVNFEEGHRYIVALRNLREADGDVIAVRSGRSGRIATGSPPPIRRWRAAGPTSRRSSGPSRTAGIGRKKLFLAWDFTVASERNLSERALSIRDAAFAELGDGDLADMRVEGRAPTFEVTGTTNFTPAEDSRIARRVEGTITVPCFTAAPGCPPGSAFAFAPGSNVPVGIPGNTMRANFICNIPRQAIDGAAPVQVKPVIYGHGLLGSASEVNSGPQAAMAYEHGYTYCATDWAGFATQDIGTVAASLQDLSHFPKLVDRMQQGFVNHMFLGRALVHPQGLGTDPAFQAAGAQRDRRRAPLLRRQQPGRDHGRRPDRAESRLRRAPSSVCRA